MRYSKFWFVLSALVLAFSLVQTAAAERGPAPIYSTDSPHAIRRCAILVFENETGQQEVEQAAEHARGQCAELHDIYTAALNGFAASLPEHELQGLQNTRKFCILKYSRWSPLTSHKLQPPGASTASTSAPYLSTKLIPTLTPV